RLVARLSFRILIQGVLCFGLLAPLGAAQAQPFTSDKRLLLWEGTLRGSPRLMGIAGAFVGIAEGAEGITRNPASAAAKDPHFENDFNVDFGGTMHFLFPGGAKQQDWDNDGRPDEAEGPFGFLGTQVLYSTIALQYKMVALGIGFDTQNFLSRTVVDGEPFTRIFDVNFLHLFGSLAFSVWKDQILFGFGVESTHAFVIYGEQAPGQLLFTPRETMGYHGIGFQFGGLWRPENEDYRLGFSFKPAVMGKPAATRDNIGGYIPFSEVAAPARLSLGASWALGSSGRHYNITSKEGWSKLDKLNIDGTQATSPAMLKWLVTTQLDVFFPVENATYVAAFLEQPTLDALPAGSQVSFQLRAAVQKEVIEERLRLFLGGYLEPPMTRGGNWVRPHGTFGGELYLFKIGAVRLAFGLSFDIAPRYQNLSIAIEAWK
ncbi:MAG: outer membrane protein transport protein, partial [Myxococcaceae bacterium]|nr:outer membrane protein transport protein [Myxococcaceae bacterium]